MSAYEGMTNADVMSGEELAEYDRDAEFRLDAADEARDAERVKDEEREATPGDECQAELIDGSYTYCPCEECQQREQDDNQADIDLGLVDEGDQPW